MGIGHEHSAASDALRPLPVVAMRNVAKEFGATRAVDGVDMDLFAGEVHCLLGENGAGKSTLMRLLAGTFDDYGGSFAIAGREVRLRSPAIALREGIALVHQELSLLPELSVAENIYLGREPPVLLSWFVDFAAMERAARTVLLECGISIDPRAAVDRLSLAERQLVEIAKGVSSSPRVLILDEPTSSLTATEVGELFAIVRRLAARGTAVVYISHKLNEIFEIADRITVLRDGRKVASRPAAEWTEDQLISSMVGRDLSALFPHTAVAPGSERLAVRDLRRDGVFGPVSFSVRAGEIVGLYGIVGAGRSQLAEAIFGLERADGGFVEVDGEVAEIRSAGAALRAGIAMVPEDRHARGLVSMLSVATNLSLSSLPQLTIMGFINAARERLAVGGLIRRLLVRASSPDQEVASLSGGNQQKVVLGRSLMPRPRVLILDEPTRGIDVVAKAEVHGAIDELARDGLAVLLISSELPEILGMSDRVLVMREGRLAGEVPRAEATEERLISMATGVA